MKARLTAITGGIGAGKSVVSRILIAMGYEVYDSDSRAKRLMDSSDEIKQQIADTFGRATISADGQINRPLLSSIVFSDPGALARLNTIVHGAVLDDIARWQSSSPRDRLFVETAILYQSGMDKMVDDVWEVIASESIRVARIVARNNISPDEAMKRIDSQRITIASPHPLTYPIDNSGTVPLLPQIHHLLRL